MPGGALTDIFRALDDAEVRYLVVGGVAVVLHGYPRFTADLDLVVELAVFSLWSPSYPGTEVDLFVEEPFDFGEAWSRRLDAVLDDGTTVHVVGIDELRALKARVGRPKDVDDSAQLDAIARAILNDDEDGE